MAQVEVQYDDKGFVKAYNCPHCGGKVKLDHEDDIGTKFFKCEKCGEQSSKLKSAQRKKWEKAIKPTYLLHPAGGLTGDFLYEPVGASEYVYHTKEGVKDIVHVHMEYEDPKEKKCPLYFIMVDGKAHYFMKKPPKKWLFAFPDRKSIEEWVKGERKRKSLKQIWNLTQIYFKTFLDFPHPHEFSIATLFIIQSWLTELISVVFYLMVKGEFGGGKSVTCETIYPLCRHGYETGNLSPPFVARTIEAQKITLYVDELDSVAGKKDSDLYSIFRQGYRKGGSYSRINPDTLEPESYQIFGPKLYTVHTEIEQALQTRTIPLHIRETQDYEYPIVNPEKAAFAKTLHAEYLLWYLDNALKLRDNHFEKFEALSLANNNQLDTLDRLDVFNQGATPQIDGESVDKLSLNIRKTLVEKKVALLEHRQVSQVSQVAGRNVELSYLCFMLSNIVNINLDDDIMRTFAQKLIEEGERTEIGYLGTLKDLLVEMYQEKKNADGYQTETREVMISNKELYNRFNKALKEEKLEGVSPHKFKEYLIEFGFTDALNRRKLEVPIPDGEKQSRLCNIFSDRVLRKLGVEENQTLAEESDTSSSKIKGIKALDKNYFGRCSKCEKQVNLCWRVHFFSGPDQDVCNDCGAQLLEKVKTRDETS